MNGFIILLVGGIGAWFLFKDEIDAALAGENPGQTLPGQTMPGQTTLPGQPAPNQRVVTLPGLPGSPAPINIPMPAPTRRDGLTPIGYLDGVTGSGVAFGWSLDPDNPNVSNTIHIYIGGATGEGTFIGSVTADRPRPDVNTVTGLPGNHGFEFQVPSQYLNGGQRAIYAYGIDTGSDGPTHLSGSPKYTVTGTPPVITPVPSGTTTPTQPPVVVSGPTVPVPTGGGGTGQGNCLNQPCGPEMPL